jgi:magnesium-protoporphyrin IX monomethyl ester (oxidative) cyclase
MILINPYSEFERWFTYPYLGTAYLASALEEIGEEVEIIDCQYMRNYREYLLNALPRHEMVGISINVSNVSSGLEIAGLIRSTHPEKKIIMGGPLATAVPDQLLPRYSDIVVLGEGEETIVEIVTGTDLSKIKGIAYWDGEVRTNPPRKFIDNLDRIPYPAWHLVNLDGERSPVRRKMAIMMTSRGCPFKCINCTKLVHGYRYRERSIPNIMGEIDYLVERFGIEEIHFWDDLFTYKPERVKELCRSIINRKYKKLRFALPGGIRADINDREMFKLMREAGFYTVIVAVESGVQRIIDSLGKRLDLKKVKPTVDTLKELGFRVGAFFMLGTPYDNSETMRKTIDFARKLKVHHAYFFITIPFPGTKLYDLVKEEGRFLQDMRLCSRAYDEGKAVYEFGQLKAEDVNRIFKNAYREFYFRPDQIWRTATKLLQDPASLFYMLQQGWRLLTRGVRLGARKK